jgi:hypothetical protein
MIIYPGISHQLNLYISTRVVVINGSTPDKIIISFSKSSIRPKPYYNWMDGQLGIPFPCDFYLSKTAKTCVEKIISPWVV